jgi:hypothetical protein
MLDKRMVNFLLLTKKPLTSAGNPADDINRRTNMKTPDRK